MHRGSRVLSLHLTDLCNSHCVFCVVGIPQRTGDLGQGAAARIRDAILRGREEGCDVVNIHGGEPTVSPRFLETLELIRDCGYPRVHLQTNGRRLKDPALVRRLRELNVELFLVSIHGRTAGTHEWLSGARGGLAETVSGISNAKAAGALVETNTVVTRQNLAELSELVDWLADLGVDHINLSNLHPAESAQRNFELVTPTVEQVRERVPEAIRRAVARKVPLSLEGFPHCALPGYETNQLRRRNGGISVEIRGMWIKDYEQFMDESQRVKGAVCGGCAYVDLCGGVYKEYVQKRGWSEFGALPCPCSANPPALSRP